MLGCADSPCGLRWALIPYPFSQANRGDDWPTDGSREAWPPTTPRPARGQHPVALVGGAGFGGSTLDDGVLGSALLRECDRAGAARVSEAPGERLALGTAAAVGAYTRGESLSRPRDTHREHGAQRFITRPASAENRGPTMTDSSRWRSRLVRLSTRRLPQRSQKRPVSDSPGWGRRREPLRGPGTRSLGDGVTLTAGRPVASRRSGTCPRGLVQILPWRP